MRIYCVNEPRPGPGDRIPNLDKLERHGPVLYVFTRREWPAKYPEDALRILDQRLTGFDPDKDALAFLGGDPFALLLIGVWAEAKGVKRLTWMRYENIEGRISFEPTPVELEKLHLLEPSPT